MPRGACTYGYCALGLLPPAEPKTKNQKNHVAGYHVDNPIKFMCGYTDRQVTFSRIPTKHMDFVCYCGLTFTLNSSIHRHYHYCAVARDAALNAIAHPPPPGAGGAGDGNGVIVAPAPPSTALVVAERSVGSILEEKLIEQHQAFLETFTGQSAKLVESMTQSQLSFLNTFTASYAEQAVAHQRSIAEHNRLALEEQRTALEEQRAAIEMQRAAVEEQRVFYNRHQNNQAEIMAEQKLTRDEVRNLMSLKRDRSFTLEVSERALKGLQSDPSYMVSPCQDDEDM
ncbi:hypothetical protein EMPS_02794 [Entomortierella parvispora]|nr:hypothetical protein EMPS_02794 [Entomortierella parvispora]